MTYLQRAGDDPSFTLVKPADTWSEAEVMLFLAGRLDADGNAVTGPLTAAAEVHTGAMIALLPTDRDARRLAVPGGEPIDQLHVTLMYLGEAAAWSLDQRVTLEMQLERYLDIIAPVEGEGFAVSIFNPPGNGRAEDGMDRETCITLVCSGSALAVVHDYVTRGVRDAEDYWDSELGPIPAQHSPWIPHITLAYTEDLELAAKLAGDGKTVGPVTFDRVRIAFGGENHDIPLNGPLTASVLG